MFATISRISNTARLNLTFKKETLTHKPNPPADGYPRSVRNGCAEGYSDYRPNMAYAEAFSIDKRIDPATKQNNVDIIKQRKRRAAKRLPYKLVGRGVKQKVDRRGRNPIKM